MTKVSDFLLFIKEIYIVPLQGAVDTSMILNVTNHCYPKLLTSKFSNCCLPVIHRSVKSFLFVGYSKPNTQFFGREKPPTSGGRTIKAGACREQIGEPYT